MSRIISYMVCLQHREIKHFPTDNTNVTKHAAIVVFLTSLSFPTQLMKHTKNQLLIF